MVVAASAVKRHPHRHRSRRDDDIDNVSHKNLFDDRATFIGGNVAAQKTRGRQLVERRLGQQVPRQLPGQELIIGQVVVKGPHDPVAIGPHLTIVVQVQSMRIPVTNGIQPVPRHVFAIVR